MARKIFIVGNGEIAEGRAAIIDAADLVVRFNDCRSFGPGGGRTDIVAICNTGRPAIAMLASPKWAAHPAIVSASSEIWSVRDPEKLAAMRPELAITHPQLHDFCDDYTSQGKAFCDDRGKRHKVVDKSIHDALEVALKAFQPRPYVVPSSGMIVIEEVLDKFRDSDITLAGFNHTGWEGHPFEAEKQLVDLLVYAGRLKSLA